MKRCPCCSEQLLRHARHDGVYWFCTHCRQEMPDLFSILATRTQRIYGLERLVNDLVTH